MPVHLGNPRLRAVRNIPGRGADPQVSGWGNSKRECLAQVVPFTDVATVKMEPLDASVLPVRHINDVVRIDRNSVWKLELAGTRACRSPFADALTGSVVFEDPRVRISVGDENSAAGSEGDVGSSAEGALWSRRQPAHLD